MGHDWTEQQKPAKVIHVVDGDTYDAVLDLGYHIRHEQRLRLAGVDTDEVYGVAHDSQEYQDGQQQSAFVKAWLREARYAWDGEWPLLVTAVDYGKFGRIVAEVERRSDNQSLGETLLAEFDLAE